jgi:hypothetical protein
MQSSAKIEIDIYPPERQGYGSFDNGKITEVKPIDFPGGTSESKRIGPLFYWSWATAKGDGVISMHPHQAFEIVSYVLEGIVGHSDSLDNKSRVGPGGAQLIQAGSGIYHQEEMYGDVTDFFQIWFEPDIRRTIKNDPNYLQIEHEEFPATDKNGVVIKSVIGYDSPLQIVADVKAQDIIIESGNKYSRKLEAGKALAIAVIAGSGIISTDETEAVLNHKDYSVLKAAEDVQIEFITTGKSSLRLLIIEVPIKVNYPLYGE